MKCIKHRSTLSTLLLVLGILVVCTSASAQTFSHIISFQGRLADPDSGKPLPDGQYQVMFTIYDAEMGGSDLWQETQTVDQIGGVFNVCLGSLTPFPSDLFTGGDRWLGIKVGADAEMPDRFRFTPSPWAIYAAQSPPDDDWAVSGDDIHRLTGNVGVGALPSSDWRLSVESASCGAATFRTTGTGGAGAFEIANPTNTSPAVLATTDGDGPAVKAMAAGTGAAGEFAVTNASNSQPALYASTFGLGSAGVFVVDGSFNENPAVGAYTNGGGAAVVGRTGGIGPAGSFVNVNAANAAPAVDAQTIGSGAAVEAGSYGEGGAGRFVNWGPTCPSPALAAETRGVGHAGWFTNSNESNTSAALVAQNLGLGEAGVFVSAADTNVSPALYAESHGSSHATSVISARYLGGIFDAAAVRGESIPADYYGVGGSFKGGFKGVVGTVSSVGDGEYFGVYGVASGVGTGTNYGVFGTAAGGTASYAGYFEGNVKVTGYLFKDGGGFQIDHPLDPGNMYLNHSFVESPDMKNVYDGVVMLDGAGEAWVELPEWFDVANRDFRYQLTAIGAPGPNLYIAEEIAGNRFRIAGGAPGMKVSWQVTGIRQDPYAEAHRIPVEELKPPHARGLYEHPELYGRPEWEGVGYAARMKAERHPHAR